MKVPENVLRIRTGRSSKDEFIKVNYPDFYQYLIYNYPKDITLNEKLYWYANNITDYPVCPRCGKRTKFHGNQYGYAKYCCPTCAQLDPETHNKIIDTITKLYGENFYEKFVEKSKQTKKERYGDPNYNNREKMKSTCIEKYGVDNAMKNKDIHSKAVKTCMEKYGAAIWILSDDGRKRKEEYIEKAKRTCMEKYGYANAMQSPDVKNKTNITCNERYGVPWNCMRQEAHNSRNSHSMPNEEFASILNNRGIEYSTEFTLCNRVYDFKIGNVLVEINPTPTHNINWNPFSKSKIVNSDYHLNKSILANDHEYRCIHVWDWDDINLIVDILSDKNTIGARDCEIKEVSSKYCNDFLNENHLQGTCRGQKVCIGLFYNDEMVGLMTFGKPRYNKKYEYELLRLCFKKDVIVNGGANRMFHFFINKYHPNSIISYCDLSKFDGKVYESMGMILRDITRPSCHWYNVKTHKHVTDNMLRQYGADKILNTQYGKGTSNEEIMLAHDFVQVFDCGQKIYTYSI